MARYIDVEGYRKLFDEEYKKTRKLIYEGETHLDNFAEGFTEASRVIDRIPTADVVSRAEVARLIDDFQRSIGADAKIGMSAGEILLHVNNMLVELKKKYTEEGK